MEAEIYDMYERPHPHRPVRRFGEASQDAVPHVGESRVGALFWQRWGLDSIALARLADSVQRAAQVLSKPKPLSGSERTTCAAHLARRPCHRKPSIKCRAGLT